MSLAACLTASHWESIIAKYRLDAEPRELRDLVSRGPCGLSASRAQRGR